VTPVGCASCSGGLLGAPPIDLGEGLPGGGCGCGDGCGGPCYPGRKPCDCCCEGYGPLGRFFCGFYQCVCCNDPCYEPRWVAAANNAFWQDSPKPITQMVLRYEDISHVEFPDKAEFFMARFKTAGGAGKNLLDPAQLATFRDLWLINEAAIDRFSMAVGISYRETSIAGDVVVPPPMGGAAVPVGVPVAGAPGAAPNVARGGSGFNDMFIATKSLLLDCELIQFSFQFTTFLPTGNFTKGVGTGHVSLEPAFLTAIKLMPDTYFQGEIAYRFPIGGDQAFEGSVLHYHAALNRVLWNCGHDIQLIGSAELNGWRIEGGAFDNETVLVAGQGAAGGVPRIDSAKNLNPNLSVGPGVRLVFCDKIDFGVAYAYGFTDLNFGRDSLIAEFRWRF
jgi:hypothetical protein